MRTKKVTNDPSLSDDEKARQRVLMRSIVQQVGDIVGLGMDNLGEKDQTPSDYQQIMLVPVRIAAKTILLVIELDENLQKKDRVLPCQLACLSRQPRFTIVIANRLWKTVFGLGLIEPADNMFDDTLATHPELMLHLKKSWWH